MSIITVLGALALAPTLVNQLANFYPPFASKLARRAYSANPDLIPTVEQLVQMRTKGSIGDGEYLSLMRQAGISNDHANALYTASRNLLTAYDYITLWRRGAASEEEADSELRALGLRDDTIEHAKQVTLYYPNPTDIVQFAVREVYNPSIVSAYGLDEDLPDDYLDAAYKGGLSDEFARQYWRAHWQLPSPSQVYDMLHRRIISEEDVNTYLRTADYMPIWRDRLIKLSYDPLTRIDVRRMYDMDILSESDVKSSYMDLGYSEDNADLLTRFAVKLKDVREAKESTEAGAIKSPTDKTVTRADVLRAYKLGYYDRRTAEQTLQLLNYGAEAIDLMLRNVDIELDTERIDAAADTYVDRYTAGDLTMDQLRTELTTLGVPARQLNLIVQRELAQAAKRIKRATKSDLDRWAMYGILTVDQYRNRLGIMGYATEDIDNYIQEIGISMGRKVPRKLSYTKYISLYKAGHMERQELIDMLSELGYSAEDVSDLVAVADESLQAPES